MHTKTPWTVIATSSGKMVKICEGDTQVASTGIPCIEPGSERRAAQIVREHNSHDAMVDALNMVLDAGTDDGEEKSATDIVEAINWPMLLAALAAAEGK